MNENTNQETRMIAQTYCGQEWYDQETRRGDRQYCNPDYGPCPSCLRALKEGERVVPDLTDEEVDAYLWDRNHGLVDSDEDWVRWSRRVGRWAYALAVSRISASRALKEGERAVPIELLDRLSLWFDWNRRVATEGFREEIDTLRTQPTEGGA